jgi:hypothetical protein
MARFIHYSMDGHRVEHHVSSYLEEKTRRKRNGIDKG